MPQLRTLFALFGLIVALIAVVLTWIAFQPPPGKPNVLLTFLCYTNDPTTGNRLARFAVTNLGASAVGRAFPYAFHISSNGVWIREGGGAFARSAELRAGGSEIIVLPPPTNHAAWKASIVLQPRHGTLARIKWLGTAVLLRVGLPARYRLMRYEIHSNVIESER